MEILELRKRVFFLPNPKKKTGRRYEMVLKNKLDNIFFNYKKNVQDLDLTQIDSLWLVWFLHTRSVCEMMSRHVYNWVMNGNTDSNLISPAFKNHATLGNVPIRSDRIRTKPS